MKDNGKVAATYNGYLVPYVDRIRELHARGISSKEIARELYAAGARTGTNGPIEQMTAAHHIGNLATMVQVILRRLGLVPQPAKRQLRQSRLKTRILRSIGDAGDKGISPDEIRQAVWGHPAAVSLPAIEAHIRQINSMLKETGRRIVNDGGRWRVVMGAGTRQPPFEELRTVLAWHDKCTDGSRIVGSLRRIRDWLAACGEDHHHREPYFEWLLRMHGYEANRDPGDKTAEG
jgi:hypothetical protein